MHVLPDSSVKVADEEPDGLLRTMKEKHVVDHAQAHNLRGGNEEARQAASYNVGYPRWCSSSKDCHEKGDCHGPE